MRQFKRPTAQRDRIEAKNARHSRYQCVLRPYRRASHAEGQSQSSTAILEVNVPGMSVLPPAWIREQMAKGLAATGNDPSLQTFAMLRDGPGRGEPDLVCKKSLRILGERRA